MFGIGFLEFCVIALVALVVFGPHKMPEMMRQFGKFFVYARRMSNEFKQTFDNVVHEAEAELQKELDLKKVEKKPAQLLVDVLHTEKKETPQAPVSSEPRA